MLKKRIILFLLIVSILLISGCSKQKTNVENISASSLSNGIRESINKANIFDVYMERISWINHHYDDKDYVTTLNVGASGTGEVEAQLIQQPDVGQIRQQEQPSVNTNVTVHGQTNDPIPPMSANVRAVNMNLEDFMRRFNSNKQQEQVTNDEVTIDALNKMDPIVRQLFVQQQDELKQLKQAQELKQEEENKQKRLELQKAGNILLKKPLDVLTSQSSDPEIFDRYKETYEKFLALLPNNGKFGEHMAEIVKAQASIEVDNDRRETLNAAKLEAQFQKERSLQK